MKEIDGTPKDALTDGVTDAVRDIAQKREAMAGWEVEYSRKRSAPEFWWHHWPLRHALRSECSYS